MDYHDLPAFMQKLAANSDQSARALEVAILTFARTIEVQNMRWSQLDLESGLWDLGTIDTKNERLKRTPLPRKALAYLREASDTSWLFEPTTGVHQFGGGSHRARGL